MQGKELKEKLFSLMEQNTVSNDNLAWNKYEPAFEDAVIQALGSFEMVQEPLRTGGGGDYDGSQAVFYFKDHDVYISVEGSYHSEYGMDFYSLSVVEPKVITETVYVNKSV